MSFGPLIAVFCAVAGGICLNGEIKPLTEVVGIFPNKVPAHPRRSSKTMNERCGETAI